MNVKTYRMDLAYDGTEFHGWQSQPSGKTIQDHIELALKTILRQDIRILGASRTDSGVHAEHQVASFRCEIQIERAKFLKSMQALLPQDISIRGIDEVSADFHPILHAKAKVYRYRIWTSLTQNPFLRPYSWSLPWVLDGQKMQMAARDLIGHHDFRAFCASDASVQTFDRTVYDLAWLQKGPMLEFYILGNGFLKQMVRSIVGTLVEIGQGKSSPFLIRDLLQNGLREHVGQTAPALGLSLLQIFYQETQALPQALIMPSQEAGFYLGNWPLLAEQKENKQFP